MQKPRKTKLLLYVPTLSLDLDEAYDSSSVKNKKKTECKGLRTMKLDAIYFPVGMLF